MTNPQSADPRTARGLMADATRVARLAVVLDVRVHAMAHDKKVVVTIAKAVTAHASREAVADAVVAGAVVVPGGIAQIALGKAKDRATASNVNAWMLKANQSRWTLLLPLA